MTLLRSFAFLLLTQLVWVTVAGAHHSFSPVYDGKRQVTVVGVVTQFKFANPHALMSMDVTDETGKVVKWTVEFAGNLNLSEKGWTANTIQAHEQVTVTGNPTHTGSPRMFFTKLVRADGTELLREDTLRSKAIDEDRRQRALQRSQAK